MVEFIGKGEKGKENAEPLLPLSLLSQVYKATFRFVVVYERE
jgi:hypothetical protein